MPKVLDSDGNLKTGASGGGGGTPGGSNTQIQYNNGGSFGGDSGFTTDGAGSVDIVGDLDVDNININGNTIAATNSNGGVAVNALGTGTVDLQVAGTSKGDLTSSGLRLGAANSRVTTILDEDTMASDSATALATQQSIKAYVDAAKASINPARCAFRAYRTTSQTISTATHTKVQLATEDYDINSTFDNATNYRHTPTVAGRYFYVGDILLQTPADQALLICEIYKNGSVAKQAVIPASGTANVVITCMTTLSMNGSTDYVELYVYHESGSNRNILSTTGSEVQLTGFYLGNY